MYDQITGIGNYEGRKTAEMSETVERQYRTIGSLAAGHGSRMELDLSDPSYREAF